LSQEQAVKAELKAVLDSWVRHEQQQREAEQAALVQTIQANVAAELEKPAFKKQLLEEALAQVERECRGVCAVSTLDPGSSTYLSYPLL
jgi:F-type H+-transporting ATPase subunit b